MSIPIKYKKALVTVAMGLRTEEDIKSNGLHRFTKNEKTSLLTFTNNLFKDKKNLLVLKIKQNEYRSEHITITNPSEYTNFVNNVDSIFGTDNEIWVVQSSVKDCWRCRIYLNADRFSPDRFEMAFSKDDHILDHIDSEIKKSLPYVLFMRESIFSNFTVEESTLDNATLQKSQEILKDVLYKYSSNFVKIKKDLEIMNIDAISIDCRVNDGYDFHDFDVSYGDVQKVVDYYVSD